MVNSMDNFWEWLEQQEEQQMCKQACKQACDCKGREKRTPHPHAEVIKAWAEGAVIQHRPCASHEWRDSVSPCFYPNWQYRIKPERVTDLEQYGIEVGDVWQQPNGTKIIIGDPVKYTANGSIVGRGTTLTLVFRRGVVNHLKQEV